MARYIGPACKLCRRVGQKLNLKGGRCLTTKCAMDARGRATGRQRQRRRRISERGLQLVEKQKARYSFGLMERQFKRFFSEAQRQPGITGDTLQVLLARRLDNVVYSLGFADSRAQARQIVRHGHILVNGRPTDIPSFVVKEGNTIGWKQSSTKTDYYKQVVESIPSKSVPGWLSLNRDTMVGQVVSLPVPGDVGAVFDGKTVVEYYSR